MGSIVCPEMSVTSYQLTLRSIQKSDHLENTTNTLRRRGDRGSTVVKVLYYK